MDNSSICSECQSTRIEFDYDFGNLCLNCGFELGFPAEEKIPIISNVPIDKRFKQFLSRFFHLTTSEIQRVKPFYRDGMTVKDLYKEMRKNSTGSYDCCQAIHYYLKNGKYLLITPLQKDCLIEDYKNYCIKFKGKSPKKNLPSQAKIIAELLNGKIIDKKSL